MMIGKKQRMIGWENEKEVERKGDVGTQAKRRENRRMNGRFREGSDFEILQTKKFFFGRSFLSSNDDGLGRIPGQMRGRLTRLGKGRWGVGLEAGVTGSEKEFVTF